MTQCCCIVSRAVIYCVGSKQSVSRWAAADRLNSVAHYFYPLKLNRLTKNVTLRSEPLWFANRRYIERHCAI